MQKFLISIILLIHSIALAADYEILEQSIVTTIHSDAFAVEQHREAVRILSRQGTSYRKYIPINSNITVKNARGTVTHPDGTIVKITEDDIVELPVLEDQVSISDAKTVAILPPELFVGSRVVVEYEQATTSLLYLSPCVFAGDVPMRKTNCRLTYPSAVPIKYRADAGNIQVQKTEGSGKAILTVQAADQRPLALWGDEEEKWNLYRKVRFVPERCKTEKWQLSTQTWKQVGEWFSELSRFAFQEEPGMDSVVAGIKAKHQTPEAIAAGLYDYIQNNFAYTAVEIGIGGHKPRFASQTFAKKYGDCKDLAVLYVTLLKKAGIEAAPALIDTRSSRFFYKDFPTPHQFNHCIAYLPKIGKGTFVDCTTKNFRFGEVPYNLHGKYALVGGELVQVPQDLKNANLLQIKLTANPTGTEVRYQGEIKANGIFSMVMNSMEDALQLRNLTRYLQSSLLDSSLPINNVQTTTKDSRTCDLNFTSPIRKTGEYYVYLLNPFRYPAVPMAVADSYRDTGFPFRIILEVEFSVPQGRFLTEPYDRSNEGKFVSYRMQMQNNSGKLKYLCDAFFSHGLMDAAELSDYRKELTGFLAKLERSVVMQ